MLMLISINIFHTALDLMKKGFFTHSIGSFGNKAAIFGVGIRSSVHIDNKKKTF